MVVKIIQQSTGKIRLFEGDDISMDPSVKFPRDGNIDEAEDDTGTLEINHSFPSGMVLACEGIENKDFDFALVQVVNNKLFINIVIDRNQYETYIMEHGKTIEHF